MDGIQFNDLDLQSMRQFYEEELEKTMKRLQHIHSVLIKLGSEPTASLPDAPIIKPSKEIKSKITKPRKQKRGPKPFWEDRILKRLSALGKPVTYEELTDDIMIAFSIPLEDRLKIKQAINNVIHRLRTESKKVNTFSLGQREKFIALKKWFDEAGLIKDEFKRLLEKKSLNTVKSAPNKTKVAISAKTNELVPAKRRGRPAGSKNKAKSNNQISTAKPKKTNTPKVLATAKKGAKK